MAKPKSQSKPGSKTSSLDRAPASGQVSEAGSGEASAAVSEDGRQRPTALAARFSETEGEAAVSGLYENGEPFFMFLKFFLVKE